VNVGGTNAYGRIEPRDGLLSTSRQPCTTASGSLVSGDHYDLIVAEQEKGLAQLHATRNGQRNAIDRYWKVLQLEGCFLVFRRKMGFQATSFSDVDTCRGRALD
jgi:hypothetical protein